MKKALLVGAGLVVSAIASSANAGFAGWAANSYATSNGNAAVDVYAMFTVGTDKLLNVFNMNISLGGATNFIQNDVAGGAWQPLPNFNPAVDDSYVTIGQAPGFSNTTGLDPNFSNNFSTLPPAPNAGWYNSNPSAFTATAGAVTVNQNDTGATLGVMIGRFVLAGVADVQRTLVVNGFASFNTGANGSSAKTFTYVPAPGALALLGLAGIAARRRRA